MFIWFLFLLGWSNNFSTNLLSYARRKSEQSRRPEGAFIYLLAR